MIFKNQFRDSDIATFHLQSNWSTALSTYFCFQMKQSFVSQKVSLLCRLFPSYYVTQSGVCVFSAFSLKLSRGGRILPLLTWSSRHKDGCGSGGIDPRILHLGTRCRCVVSFTLWSLYPCKHRIGSWGVLEQVWTLWRTISCPWKKSNPDSSGVQPIA